MLLVKKLFNIKYIMLEKNLRSLTFFWITSFVFFTMANLANTNFYLINISLVNNFFLKSFCVLFFCFLINIFLQYFNKDLFSYLLFFLVSITSYLGLTKTLTGSHAEASNIFLYGFSFYTTSLAYINFQRKINQTTFLTVSNPLLVVTGPIAVFVKNIQYKNFLKRWDYYFPFFILGLFLHQAISTPLTLSMHLIEKTDVVSSLTFAVIFEFFVYANFCGLSLIVYGLAGIFGFSIPLNFKQPFASGNIVDFWRGWHISLSLVLKKLFYNPVKNFVGGTLAIFVVYFSSAMWHGVTLNFLLWGLFHACMFSLTLWLLKRKIRFFPFFIFLFSLVFGRLLFADANFDRLLLKLKFNYEGFLIFDDLMALPNSTKFSLVIISSFVFSEFLFKNTKYFRKRNYKFFRIPSVQVVLMFITFFTLSATLGVDYAVYGQR